MIASFSRLSSHALLLAGVAFSAPALAQDNSGTSYGGLEDIVVTAQKREENLQQAPIAITAMTASSLKSQGISDLTGIVQASPNLYFAPYPSSSTTLVLYMRGQGFGDPMIITKDGGVGLYVDGFYQSRPQASTFDLADIERVEVLRGPQGTLYGRNTTGGAVNIITKKPSGEFNVRGDVSVGNYDYRRALLNIDLPETAGFSVKLTGLYSERDGWAKNPNSSADVKNNNFLYDGKLAFRGAVRWQNDDVTVDYVGDVSEHKTTPILYVSDNPIMQTVFPGYKFDPKQAWRSVHLPKSKLISDGHSLTVEWEASDALTLRSLTSYRHIKMLGYQDYVETFLVPFTAFDDVRSKTYTQEVQAIGNIGDSFRYVAGLYYFNEKASHYEDVYIGVGDIGFGGDSQIQTSRMTNAKSTSMAAYGQLTWIPEFANEQLELTVGGRYTRDKRRASRNRGSTIYTGGISHLNWPQFNAPGGFYFPTEDWDASYSQTYVKNSKFNPAVTLSYLPTEDITVYAKFVTGYKAGGTHEGAPLFTRTFAPETVKSYEAGLKTDLFDHRLRINLAGFLAKYKDLQLDISASAEDQSLSDTFNIGRATVKGLEAEITAAPIHGLTLSANYAYIHSKLTNILAPAGSIFDPALDPNATTVVGDDISDHFVLPFTPKHSLRFSGDWQIGEVGPGMVSVHADYTWKDMAYTTSGAGVAVPNRHYPVNPSYGIVDARISYDIDRGAGQNITIALWGKNVFDKRYPGFVVGSGSIRDGYHNAALTYGTPRTYGIDIGFSF